MGVLLGMAASRRGTLDSVISKMLFLHIPARHPATYPELELSPLVQASALLGVGLLYQGSCHRSTLIHGHLFVRLFVRLFVHSFVHARRVLHWGMVHMTVSSTLHAKGQPCEFPLV